jgi:hypothetical protein
MVARRNPLRINLGASCKTLLLRGLQFPVEMSRYRPACLAAIRNSLRIDLWATRKMLLLSRLQFPMKPPVPYRPARHLAIRNPLRIRPGTIRKALVLGGMGVLAKASARYRMAAIRNLLHIGLVATRKTLLRPGLEYPGGHQESPGGHPGVHGLAGGSEDDGEAVSLGAGGHA